MKVNADFVLRNIYGKNILMPVRKNNISIEPILLNDVAAYIWEKIEHNISGKNLLQAAMKDYAIENNSEELLSIEKFLNYLINIKLVELESDD